MGREEVEKSSWLCTLVEGGAPRCPKAAQPGCPQSQAGERGPSLPEPVTFLKMGHHLHYMVCPLHWAGGVLLFLVTLLIVDR